MMSLEELHALWAADDEAKMAIARKSGPAGVLVGEDGRSVELVDFGGDLIELPDGD